MWYTVSFSTVRCCAFCTHWFDPKCESIQPKDTLGNLWMFQKEDRRLCIRQHRQKQACQYCKDFEMKIK